ncbi:tRNA 2-thiouridine(34) synthase MnmA [cyanobiont of Ornithocercus magnificus]|nr:tRNA 2-thiouridine(34) synthase MnmA [cyanobiont of Ornithocercus magnificus]
MTHSGATKAGAAAIEWLMCWSANQNVVVGLSGGVDSSLAAALLVEAGWKVEGLTFWLMSGKGTCCTEGLVDAANICQQLGIPHHVVDARETFQQEIVQVLLNGYQSGITPLPCSRCNKSVKFAPMLAWARQHGLSQIATGHYARVHRPSRTSQLVSALGDSSGRCQLLRGHDSQKDQSYFLYDLPQEVLKQVLFPLGELSKANTRIEAKRRGLRTADKPESQDLCLADHYGSMHAFLKSHLPHRKGQICLSDGTVLGHHDGIQNFTIGQRRGLRVAWTEPLHVTELDAVSNRVIVAPRSQSGRSFCTVGAVNWVSIAPPQEPFEVEVQVRYRSQPAWAQLTPIQPTEQDIATQRPHRCHIDFYEKQFSITPGQAAVFYEGDILLGGGLIQCYSHIN